MTRGFNLEKDNSDKQKNSQWIWQVVIGLVVLVLISVIVYFAARPNFSSLESSLLQVFSLIIGCGFTYWVGKLSVKKARDEILKPHARSAARYLISLNKSISRARTLASIGLPQRFEAEEDYHVIRGAIIATLGEQLVATDDALENWRDILEEELEDLIQKLREESTTPELLEDFIRKLTPDNTSEDE